MNTFKIVAIGAAGFLGLASAGALAQQADAQRSPANPQMNQQMMGNGGMKGMMGMMNDPEMRKEMTEMMSNCNRMMERMGTMSGAQGNRS